MAEFIDKDDPEIHGDSNPQEEPTDINHELRDDVAAQVQDPQESRQIVCGLRDSSSRTGESNETGEITTVAEEDNDRYDGDDEDEPKSDDETCSLVTQPRQELGPSDSLHTLPPQQPVRFGSCDPFLYQTPHRSVFDMSHVMMPHGDGVGFRSPLTLPRNTVGLPPQFGSFDPSLQSQNPHRSGSDTSQVMMPPGENAGFGSLVNALSPGEFYNWPLYQNSHRSGSDSSQVIMHPGENAGLGRLVTQPSHQNPRLIARSNQTTNPQQQFTRPIRGSTSYASDDHNNSRQSFGMQRQLSARAAPWRPRNTYQQYPVANQIPNLAPMQTQMFTLRPAIVDPNYAPWRSQNTYQQYPVANQIPNLAPMQTQMFTRGPALIYRNYAPVTRGPASEPVTVLIPPHLVGQLDNMWRMRAMPYLMANQQNIYQQHPMANQAANQVPWQRMTIIPAQMDSGWRGGEQYRSMGVRPIQDPVIYPYQQPEADELDLRMTISPNGEPRTVDVFDDHSSSDIDNVLGEIPTSAAGAELPVQTQTEDLTEFPGPDAGESSEQGRDQDSGAA